MSLSHACEESPKLHSRFRCSESRGKTAHLSQLPVLPHRRVLVVGRCREGTQNGRAPSATAPRGLGVPSLRVEEAPLPCTEPHRQSLRTRGLTYWKHGALQWAGGRHLLPAPPPQALVHEPPPHSASAKTGPRRPVRGDGRANRAGGAPCDCGSPGVLPAWSPGPGLPAGGSTRDPSALGTCPGPSPRKDTFRG